MARRVWPRLALITLLGVSLMGNAFTIGGLVRLQQFRIEALGGTADAGMRPRAVRQALNTALASRGAEIEAALQAAVAARARVMETGMTPPFDRDATLAAMADFRVSFDHALDLIQASILDGLEQASANR